MIAAARQGDRNAFDKLIRAEEEGLRRYIISRAGHDGAEDALQETRVAAWLGLASFSGKTRVRAWLFGIAYYKCQDYHRSRIGSSRRESPLEVSHQERPDPHDRIASAEAKLLALAVLESLPVAQREVMELYYYGGLTLNEVATVLGRSPNTIKSQFYRAHVRAVEIMEPNESGVNPQPIEYWRTREEPTP